MLLVLVQLFTSLFVQKKSKLAEIYCPITCFDYLLIHILYIVYFNKKNKGFSHSLY